MCKNCGRVADRIDEKGLCDSCGEWTPTEENIAHLVYILQTKYVVHVTKEGRVRLKNWKGDHTFHNFLDWQACHEWAAKMEWD